MNEVLVKKKLLDKKYVKKMEMFYDLSKKIISRDIKKISGKEYEEYYKEAREFIDAVKKIVEE